MSLNINVEAASGDFQKVNATQNNLDFFLSSPPKVVKKSNSKKLNKSNKSSNLTTTNELDTNSLLNNSTQTPTDTSVTATNADDYTRNTAGENARPTPISADFAENIEFNKTLLIEFVEVLLKATPPEHKNPVAAALNALRETNKYKLTIPCLLDAFVCGLVKLNVPKNIITLTTPILCAVLPDTTPELVERKLNEENNGFELEFFSQYLAENYDNFAGKFVDNSWLVELNKAKNGFVKDGSNLSREKVLEMPPAEPEISQATGTHGDLPNNFNEIKIKNAEAQKDAPAEKYSNVIINEIKGNAQKVNIMSIINENSNISNENTDLSADFSIDTLKDKELIAKFNSIVSDSDKCKFFFDTFCDTYNDKQQHFNFLEIDKVDSVVFFSNNLKCIKVSEVRKILTNDFVFTNGKNVADIKGENLFVGLLSNNQGEHKLIFTDTNGTNYSYGNAKNCYFQVYNQPLQNVIVVKNITEAIIANSYFMDRIKFGDCSFEIVIIYDDFIATIENIADNIDDCKLFAFCHANNATSEISNIYFITENLKHTFLSLLKDCDNNDAIKQVYYTELAKYISDVIDNAITGKERPQIEENCESLKRWNDDDLAFKEPFPLKDFPEIIQNIVKANHRTPPALTALTAITIFATSIQAMYDLKAFKDGKIATLPINISTFILAPSSAGKSSTLKLLTGGINSAQEFWKEKRIKKLAKAEQTRNALIKERNKKEINEHTISTLEDNLKAIESETPPQNIFHFDGTATSEAIKDLAEVNKNLLFSNAEAANIFNSSNANETRKFLSDRSQIHDGFLPSHYTKTNGCNESTNVRASQVYMMQPETFKSLGDDFLHLLVKQGTLARALFDCIYSFKKPPLNPDILPSEKDTENEFIKLFNDIIYKLLTTYKIDVKDNILSPKYELTFSNDCYKFYCEKDAEIIELNEKQNSLELAIIGKKLETSQRLAPTFHLIDLITNELQSNLDKKYGVAGGFNLEKYSKIPISLDCLKRAYNVADYCAKSQMFYFGGGKNYEQDSDDYKLKIEVVKKLFNQKGFKEKMQTTSAMLATAIRTGSKKTFKNIKKADIDRIMPYLQLKGVFLSTDTQTINSRGYVYSINPALYEFPSFDAYANEMRLFK